MCNGTSKSGILLIHFNTGLCLVILGGFYVSSTSSWNTSPVILQTNKCLFPSTAVVAVRMLFDNQSVNRAE